MGGGTTGHVKHFVIHAGAHLNQFLHACKGAWQEARAGRIEAADDVHILYGVTELELPAGALVRMQSFPTLPPSTDQRVGTVTADRLNMRDAPWGRVLGQLERHNQVIILAELGNWYKIVMGQAPGFAYVHKSHIRENQ
jgi:hypothetical protein